MPVRHQAAVAAALALTLAGAAPASAANIAIAGFDYSDTSGEPRDQTAEHAARMRDFLATLREKLDGAALPALVLPCAPACTAGDTNPAALIADARRQGAALLVYGGIHKVSTLIQYAIVQVVDLSRDALVLERQVSFRGDTDDSWRRAARFIAGSLRAGLDQPHAQP